MKTFEQIYRLNESYPYKKSDGSWDTKKLTRWYRGGDKWTPVGQTAESLKDFVSENFAGLYRENAPYDSERYEEAFYMVNDNNEKIFRVELFRCEGLYKLYITKNGKGIKEWKTEDAEHAGAMMEYLFGDL